MARGVGEDPEPLAATGQPKGAKLQCPCLPHVQVGYEDVEVCLLRVLLSRPLGRDVIRSPLERDLLAVRCP